MKSKVQRKAKSIGKAKQKQGIFLTFEGGEGVGKTTQIARLAHRLEKDGYTVVVTREPGGSTIANRIRSLLLDPKMKGLVPLAELFLYQASRAQHVQEVIRPALAEGKIVICDRYTDSSLVYQGAGRGLARELVKKLNGIATGGLSPQLTFLFDLDPRIGLARIGARGILDRMEKEALSFHQSVQKGFMALLKVDKKRYRRIDASQSRDEIHDAIWAIVSKKL